MYGILTKLLVVVAVAELLIDRKRRRPLRRMKYGVFAGVFVLLVLCMNFFPIENLFVGFSSPETAVNYAYAERTDIPKVMGDETALLCSGDRTYRKTYVVRRDARGWKIENQMNKQLSMGTLPPAGAEHGTVIWTVVRHKGTGECYLMLDVLEAQQDGTLDLGGLEPQAWIKTQNEAWYAVYLGVCDGTYDLTLNGETYPIEIP